MAQVEDLIKEREVLLQLRTKKTDEQIESKLKDVSTVGEITIQTPVDTPSGTSLWTLAEDGTTAVKFLNKEQVEELVGDIQDYVSGYTISEITGEELAELGNNVRAAYKLIDIEDNIHGAIIKIYKDSSLLSVYLGHVDDILTDEDPQTHESPTSAITEGSGDAALCFIYELQNGNYKLVAINVETFITENEFADGLQVNDHVVSVVTQDIATATDSGVVSLAESYNVKQYAVNDVKENASANVATEYDETTGVKVLNFSRMIIDCGTY